MSGRMRLLVLVIAIAAIAIFALLAREPGFFGAARPAAAPQDGRPAPGGPGKTPGQPARPAIPVKVAAIVEQRLADEVAFVAAVEPSIATTIGAEIDGRVAEMRVQEGDRVVAGQTVVARIETGPREIQLREARAMIARAREELAKLERGYRTEEIDQRAAEVAERKAVMDRAEQDHRRAQRLHAEEMISTADLDRSRAEYLAAKQSHERALAGHRMLQAGPRPEEIAQARADLAHAEARADRIADEIRRAAIVAAITGHVVRKHVDVGSWLRVGDRVVDLVALDPVFVTGAVGEREIPRVRIGQHASVTVDAHPGRPFEGKVTAIVPGADPASRTFPVRVTVTNPAALLKAGMFARVAVRAGDDRRGLLAPKDAVVRRGGQDFLFLVDGEAVRQLQVETRMEVGSLVEVRGEGLAVGQRAVTLGNEFLQPGMAVTVQ